METMKVKLVGTVPVIMHSNRAANPLSKEAKALKQLTSKRNKTDKDHEEIARIEWEAGLYLKNGVVVMPAQNVEKCFLLGARKSKNGKQFESGVYLSDLYMPMEYKGPKIRVTENGFPNAQLDRFYPSHNWQEMVKVGTQQVLRTRPIFEEWSFACDIDYDSNIINEAVLMDCLKDAGKLIGLCERRPRYGRFNIEVL